MAEIAPGIPNPFDAERQRRGLPAFQPPGQAAPAAPVDPAPTNPFEAERQRRGLPPGRQQDFGRFTSETVEPAESGVARQLAGGINEQLANIIDLPMDVANAVLSIVPGMPVPEESQNIITNFLRDSPDPVTAAERISRRIGEEVVRNVIPAAVPFLAAAAPAKTTAQATGSVAERVVGNIVQGVRNTPVRAATGELAATVGAGAGAGIAQELAPGSDAAEITGQVAGGLAPAAVATTPTALVGRGIGAVARRVSPAAQRQAAEAEVRRVVGDELTPTAQAGIDEAEALRQEIPGFNPSLAESTGSPSLARTQELVESRATGPELEAFVGRRAANEAAIAQTSAGRGPAAQGDPEFIVDTANKRVTSLKDRVSAQQDLTGERLAETGRAREGAAAVAARQREGIASALPVADRTAAGGTLRSRLLDNRREASAEMSRLADELGINNADVTVEFGAARDEILEQFKPNSVFEDISNFPEVLRDIRRAGTTAEGSNEPQVTFADLKALRERLTDDLLDAQSAAAPSKKKIRLLVQLQQRVDGLIDTLIDQAEPGLASRYAQFRQTYRTQYIDRFEQGAAFKVRQRDGRGYFKIPDEKVAEAFFQPGNVSAARQFRAVFGDDPEAAAALEAVVFDSLRDAAVRDGEINPRLLANWIKKRRSILSEFSRLEQGTEPVADAVTAVGRRLEDSLASFDGTADALTQRQATLRSRERAIENTKLSKSLAKVSRGDRDAADVIDEALRNPVLLDQLVGSLRNDPAAMNAFRRTIWDKATAGGSAEIQSFLETNEVALRRLLGSKHLTDIRRILRAREMVEAVPSPRGRAFEPNPLRSLEDAIGMGVPQLASRVFAAKSGRTSIRYVMTDWFGRFVRGRSLQESEALLKEALYDPEIARDMSTLLTAKRERPEVARRLNTRLLNLGFGNEEEEQTFGRDQAEQVGGEQVGAVDPAPPPSREDLRELIEDKRPLEEIQAERASRAGAAPPNADAANASAAVEDPVSAAPSVPPAGARTGGSGVIPLQEEPEPVAQAVPPAATAPQTVQSSRPAAAPPPSADGGLPIIRSQEEFDALPPGTFYQRPDGSFGFKR